MTVTYAHEKVPWTI